MGNLGWGFWFRCYGGELGFRAGRGDRCLGFGRCGCVCCNRRVRWGSRVEGGGKEGGGIWGGINLRSLLSDI